MKGINGFSNAIRGIHVLSYTFTRHITNCQPQQFGQTATTKRTRKIFWQPAGYLSNHQNYQEETPTQQESYKALKKFDITTSPRGKKVSTSTQENVPLHECVCSYVCVCAFKYTHN